MFRKRRVEVVPPYRLAPICTSIKQVVDHSHRGARLETTERSQWGKRLPVPLANIFDDAGPRHDYQKVRQEGQEAGDRHLR